MATLHMTEAEIARDLHGVLEKVRQGAEVVVEDASQPVVVIHQPERKRRTIAECIAIAKARGSKATIDPDFMKDVEEGIARHREPWNPPSWD